MFENRLLISLARFFEEKLCRLVEVSVETNIGAVPK